MGPGGESWIHEAWGTMVQPLASTMPYHVTVGNHEWDHTGSGWPTDADRAGWAKGQYGEDSGGDCGIPYIRRFQMPNGTSSSVAAAANSSTHMASPTEEAQPPAAAAVAAKAMGDGAKAAKAARAARAVENQTPATVAAAVDDGPKQYYSLDIGPVHFVVLSIETDFGNASAQLGWLDRDLAATDRSRTPWVIVAHHRMIWLDALGAPSALESHMQQTLEPLYIEHGVDLVLSGHAHTYARHCAMRHGVCQTDAGGLAPGLRRQHTRHTQNAPVYIVDGTAGAYTGGGNQGVSCTQPTDNTPPTLARDCMWGWSRMAVNRTALHWEHLRWTGNVSDEVVLRKGQR